MEYVDTSALVKLAVHEEHSDAMSDWTRSARLPVTSDLTRTELMRAVTRVHPDRALRVRDILDAVETVALDREALDTAGRLAPPSMRSLDAIHLAVALSLGEELDAFITYDDRLAAAAAANGLRVVAPGR